MLRYTISAPELQTGVCYRTIHLSTPAQISGEGDEGRAKRLATQIFRAIPASDLQTEGIAALFETSFDQPLTLTETVTLTEAFGNPNLQWGARENDKIDMLVANIYIPRTSPSPA